MQLSHALVPGLGLASSASGYVVTMYKDPSCRGASRRLNVWDNTCSDPGFDPKSVRVEVFGRAPQNARFYSEANCLAGKVLQGPWRADHENYSWKIGACLDMKGWSIKSFGSRIG
ncbi:hypothetical protein CSHISOI_09474 [Colletotrichum shisoi]|uniref:Uncharacterized protein n=1 Tax=Colletotrichum shisoi TaxID=2078593 RepID=A0A5Q4BGE2_9PEZI|nr:hypothetical protein CSHISOI_09474 [Colletotrichum shisoi]